MCQLFRGSPWKLVTMQSLGEREENSQNQLRAEYFISWSRYWTVRTIVRSKNICKCSKTWHLKQNKTDRGQLYLNRRHSHITQQSKHQKKNQEKNNKKNNRKKKNIISLSVVTFKVERWWKEEKKWKQTKKQNEKEIQQLYKKEKYAQKKLKKSPFSALHNDEEADMKEDYQRFRLFSRLVGRSDPWSKKNGGPFSEMMGPSISN